MWKGRFSVETADLVQRFGESVSYDWRMFREDVRGSIAHARAQVRAGLLTEEEFGEIESGLREIEGEESYIRQDLEMIRWRRIRGFIVGGY